MRVSPEDVGVGREVEEDCINGGRTLFFFLGTWHDGSELKYGLTV